MRLTPASLALIYVVISFVWILSTSELLYFELQSAHAITAFEIAKGTVFILATGGLIYWLMRRLSARLLESERALRTSEQKRRKLESQLHRSEKLEALGRLAAGVTHD